MNKALTILLIVLSMFISKFLEEALLVRRIYQIYKAFSIQMVFYMIYDGLIYRFLTLQWFESDTLNKLHGLFNTLL